MLPGISCEETIRINPRPERILDPNAAIGKIDGNPVSDDMIEAAELFGIDFGVNCILNNEMKIAAVFTGSLVECHSAAVKYVRDYLGVGIEKPDVIVTCPGQPLDIDFYQSAKALIGLTEILDGDIVTLLTCGCAEGVNSPDMLRAFGSGKTLPEVEKWTTEHYEIQMDHVLLLAKIYRKGARVILSCPNVSDDEARTMLMEPVRDVQKALERAMALTGKACPKVLFYPRPQTGSNIRFVTSSRTVRPVSSPRAAMAVSVSVRTMSGVQPDRIAPPAAFMDSSARETASNCRAFVSISPAGAAGMGNSARTVSSSLSSPSPVTELISITGSVVSGILLKLPRSRLDKMTMPCGARSAHFISSISSGVISRCPSMTARTSSA